ncbi:Ig-like domain repeat protein [Streptomyces nigrescens]|uniref:Ig-like domain repeat protein n=1 Tax=Streptomyces nigrescens TaxID=1920 RepID=UPI0036FF6861
MLTPERPSGLVILTDHHGNCIAVLDPWSHRIVPTLSAPVPLVARGDAHSPVLCTVVDHADVPASNDSGTLLRALAELRNTVTANYSGDANFSSSSGTDSQTVDPASTLTTVTATPGPSVVGQPVTFTATVTPVEPGAGVPAGAVTFDFGDGTPPTPTSVSDGVVRITHTYTSAGGPYTVTAQYEGDDSFTSSSGSDTQTVGRAATTTAVVSSPDPTVVGQSTTVTAAVASVAPGAGAPSGTVTFDFGDGSPTLTAPVSNGLATVTHAYGSTSGSPFAITGTYDGDANFTSSSGNDTQTVGKAGTTTAVASSPDPTVVGQPTTLTASVASVTPGAAAPTGTVTFSFGDGTGSTTTLSDGIATVTHTYTTRTGSPFPVTADLQRGCRLHAVEWERYADGR